MNKTIYEAEFTKMVHDKMREANKFKVYERIPKNRIGGDYWNTYWTIRYMLHTMIRKALKKEGLYVNKFQNAYGVEVYRVVNKNNVIQSPEQGMYFNELAKYAELV